MSEQPTGQPVIVIAIARQLGAGGAQLGQRLASRLQLTYLDREILHLAAQRIGTDAQGLSGCEERVSGFWQRVIDTLAVGPPENIYTSVPGEPVRDQGLFNLEAEIIREVTQHRSSVVIGRGSFWILRDHPGAVRVLLHSPPEARVAVIQREYNFATAKEAREMIDRVDRDRERFVQTMTGRSLHDARNYDLTINTQAIPSEVAEEMVAAAAERKRAALAGG